MLPFDAPNEKVEAVVVVAVDVVELGEARDKRGLEAHVEEKSPDVELDELFAGPKENDGGKLSDVVATDTVSFLLSEKEAAGNVNPVEGSELGTGEAFEAGPDPKLNRGADEVLKSYETNKLVSSISTGWKARQLFQNASQV